MNGRTYDTRLGRFMQADIAVQSPFDTQSYNRYSYLMNNPLNGTDPSGYFSLKEGAMLAVAVVASYVTYGAASGWAAGMYATATGAAATSTAAVTVGGIVGGAAGGFVSGGIMTGSMEGALQGAFSGAVMGSIGAGFANADMLGSWQHIATAGTAGGAISVLQGGKFGAGFISAGFSAGAMPAIQAYIGNEFIRVAAAAVVGGTTSVVSGGKFANGAMTGAFQAAIAEFSSSVHDSDSFSTSSAEPEIGTTGVENSSDEVLLAGEHTKGARPSTLGKHEKGEARRNIDRGGEKGDRNRSAPRVRPPNFKGPWPPRFGPPIILPFPEEVIEPILPGYIPDPCAYGCEA